MQARVLPPRRTQRPAEQQQPDRATEKAYDSTVSVEQVCRALDRMGMGDEPGVHRLTPFVETTRHYVAIEDEYVKDAKYSRGLNIQPEGRRLLANYYRRTHDANIVLPEADGYPMTEEAFVSVARQYLEPLRARQGEFRCAFSVGDLHAVPVVYIKEQGREAILVGDSLGGYKCDIAGALADEFHSEKNFTVYRVDEQRQMDHNSCFAVVIKFGVTLTGHVRREDGSFGDYILPNVLTELESREKASIFAGKVRAVRLPDELAKDAQTRAFINAQRGENPEPEAPLRDEKQKPGQKPRTLTGFLDDYQITAMTITDKDPEPKLRPRADYMRQKGFRYADIIQIEDYNERLTTLFGEEKWPAAKQEKFVEHLKQIVRKDREARVIASDASPQREGKV